MLDMEQEIEFKWTYSNRKWFAEKGYRFTNWGDTFFAKLKDVHPGSKIHITFVCDVCGKNQTTLLYSYNKKTQSEFGDTCKQCSAKKTIDFLKDKRKDMMYSKIISAANEKGYKLITTKDEYINQRSKIKYICPKHGIKEMTAQHFVNGTSCKECTDENHWKINLLPISEVIRRIESVNNNKLLNPEEYKRNDICNLKVKCGCGNIFYMSLNQFPDRYRCQKCTQSMSLGEKTIEDFLINHNIEYKYQHSFDSCRDKHPLPFDFYLPNRNTCIEYDGEQHYQPVFGEESFQNTAKHDRIKDRYCKINNIHLIRIPYYNKKNIKDILIKELELCKRNSLIS